MPNLVQKNISENNILSHNVYKEIELQKFIAHFGASAAPLEFKGLIIGFFFSFNCV